MVKKKHRKTTLPLSVSAVLPWLAVLSSLVVMALITYYLARTFSVQTIVCKLENQPECSQLLRDSLNASLLNQGMFFEDYHTVLTQSGELPEPVSLIQIRKYLPNTLELTFQLEQPLYRIVFNHSNALVSTSGKLFHNLTMPDQYITVTTQEELIMEGKVKPEIHQTLSSIITWINQLKLPVAEIIWVDKSTIRLSMMERTEVAILDSERPVLALHKLAVILKSEEYSTVQSSVTEIDLRFAMPVLRTKP